MGRSKNIRDWIVLDRLADIILEGVHGCIVDIGMGLSTIVLGRHAVNFGRRHYSVDISPDVAKAFGNQHGGHKVFVGDSLDIIKRKKFREKPAIVFIDGCHEYRYIKEEVDFFLDMLMPFGVIFFHDSYPPERWAVPDGGCGDVYLVRQELEKRDDLWTFTWPYEFQAQGCGLTMVMKKIEAIIKPFIPVRSQDADALELLNDLTFIGDNIKQASVGVADSEDIEQHRVGNPVVL